MTVILHFSCPLRIQIYKFGICLVCTICNFSDFFLTFIIEKDCVSGHVQPLLYDQDNTGILTERVKIPKKHVTGT